MLQALSNLSLTLIKSTPFITSCIISLYAYVQGDCNNSGLAVQHPCHIPREATILKLSINDNVGGNIVKQMSLVIICMAGQHGTRQ